jgi:hypothetical protein
MTRKIVCDKKNSESQSKQNTFLLYQYILQILFHTFNSRVHKSLQFFLLACSLYCIDFAIIHQRIILQDPNQSFNLLIRAIQDCFHFVTQMAYSVTQFL